MKRLALTVAAVAMLGGTYAQAADVTIKLNDQEQQALIQLLDLATKQGGVRVAGAVAAFVSKLQPPQSPTAIAPAASDKPAEKPATPPVEKK